MRKEEILKKIVEDDNFREKYWKEFKIDTTKVDYSGTLRRPANDRGTNNKYLKALDILIMRIDLTDKIKWSQIQKLFEI